MPDGVPRGPSPRHGDRTALRWRSDDDAWGEWTFAELRRPGGPGRRRPAGDWGVEPGDRVVLMMRNIPEFHVLDLAAASAAPRRLDLQLVVARAGRVPGRPLRGDGRRSSRTRFLERFLKVRDELADLETIVRRRRRRRPARRRRHLRRRCSTATPIDLAAAAADCDARRPRHDHLHLGHHRAAQGRDALAPQHRVDRREPAAVARLDRRRAASASASSRTCRWPTSPSG